MEDFVKGDCGGEAVQGAGRYIDAPYEIAPRSESHTEAHTSNVQFSGKYSDIIDAMDSWAKLRESMGKFNAWAKDDFNLYSAVR